MSELKVAVIADRGRVQLFGLNALDALRCCGEITLFSCLNTRAPSRSLRHFGYYALSLLAVRNPFTRYVPVAQGRKRIAATVAFDSRYEGNWQTLPPEIVARLAGFDVIVKLGMGLLRVPPPEALPVPILAFHHGDPERYRGRPAGFWEMVERAPTQGQIVQILSNRLDSGRVVAFAETKVYPQSYRATLIEAYSQSHHLLNEAVRNARAGTTLPKSAAGRNYRLPSNLAVLGLVARMATTVARRLVYGALVETRWCVSLAQCAAAEAAAVAEGGAFPPTERWRTLPTPRDYLYLADPFFSRDPEGLLVEALSRRTGIGDIGLVTDQGYRRLTDGTGHFSYPGTVTAGGEQLVVPEMAQWGEQRCFRIREGRLVEAGTLEVEGRPRLLDPTLVEHGGRLYLFANDAGQGSSALFLWSADALDRPFRLHPFSPVRISPSGGRMAGAVLSTGGRLIRFGQSFLGDYGDGVFAFEIEKLAPDDYRERPIGAIKFADRLGPHTLNFDGRQVLFDWYTKGYSALAGVRRARARLGR